MRWSRLLAVAACSLGAAAAIFALTAAAPPAKTVKQDQVKRGEYLAIIAGCNDCHTPGTLYGDPDFSRQLSGSELGWQGPWGVSYPRNLTPDVETGIGKWSKQDIVNTLRTGQRPDGSVLLPPMPWPDTSHMTESDLQALAAYLKSLPAVKHQVPNRLPPGATPTGSFIAMPAPSAWDAPRHAPGGAPGDASAK